MRQRQPRQHDEPHLAFIRTLPCLVCGNPHETQAAHIRFADLSVAKLAGGISIKPDDKYAVPLCGLEHNEQHDHGDERGWWTAKGIDPVKVALALYSVSGDFARGEQIVRMCRNQNAA